MKPPVKYALIFTLLWIMIKMIFHYSGALEASFTAGILLNLLFVLLAISLGLHGTYKLHNYRKTIFLDDVKVGMQAGLLYAVLISGFIYIYYEKVDNNYLQQQVEEKVAFARQQVEDPENFQKMKTKNENLKGLSKDDYIELVEEDASFIHSGFIQSTLSLLALMIMSFFYSMMVALLFRKLLLKGAPPSQE